MTLVARTVFNLAAVKLSVPGAPAKPMVVFADPGLKITLDAISELAQA